MRLCLFLLAFFTSQSWAVDSFSQEVRLSMSLRNVKVIDVLNKIENETDYFFLFNQKLVNVDRVVNMEVRQRKVEDILSQLFEGTNVDYILKDRQIVLTTGGNEYSGIAGQQKGISGSVTGTSGEPLPGVTVIIKGTSQGTVTDNDGRYTLNGVTAGQVLQFSFVGMETQEVSVGNQQVVNVSLRESTIGLEEVVAIGYGTMKKSDLTGSVSSLGGEKLQMKSTPQLSSQMQGQMAGVQITRSSGDPSAGATIRVHGVTTMSTNDPLVIVDGIPGTLTDIAPEDVKDILYVENQIF